MIKIHCRNCTKYRKFKNTNPIFEKTLVLSTICSEYENEDQEIFKEEESIQISKILDLIKII